MNTRSPFKEQPPAASNTKKNKVNNPPPERPDWSFWKRRGYCRIWQAALLSLDVEPSHANRAKLKEAQPDRYAEYRKRREIVIINRGHHPLLTAMEHTRAGEKDGEQYVGLAMLLDFAKEQRWSMVDAFTRGMTDTHAETSAFNAEIQDADEEETDVHDLKRKGDRYLLVRMGAL